MKRINLIAFCLTVVVGMISTHALSAASLWTDITNKSQQSVDRVNVSASHYRLLNGDYAQISQQLLDRTSPYYDISLPMPDGALMLFRLQYAPIYQAGLAQKYPSIRTFKGFSLDHPNTKGRFDITPHGFHAMIKYQNSWVFIDPLQRGNNQTYVSYYKKNAQALSKPLTDQVLKSHLGNNKLSNSANKREGETLKTYRLAVSASGEYTAFHGGTKALGQAAIVTTINRVNEVYNVDLSVQLTLISNNDTLVYTDADTDPFANTPDDIGINQTTIDNEIGSANYDIGHIMNTGAGGLAGLGVVCNDSSKALGATGTQNPTGDPFNIDYVAHELGHQFGGEHSFNGTAGNCGTRSAADAYEPGSGSTIMAYAGICADQNIQNNSDAFFHSHSVEQMGAFINGSGASCAATSAINNEPPAVNAGNDYTIPASTPIKLSGAANDPDDDTMSFSWEQFDLGTQSTSKNDMIDDGSRPLFRTYLPTSSAMRYLPKLTDVVAGTTTLGETMATTSRDMTFKLMVRDGKGNTASDTTKITVDSASGPFKITAPASGDSWVYNTTPTVTWDVANTSQAPVSCANVDILLSTDNGISFDQTVLSGTVNDGSEAITVPALNSDNARLQVMCSDNIFFAVNDGDFTITGIDSGASAPVISAQSTLSLDEDNTLTVAFTDLTVSDSDSNYPDGFSMTLTTGSNYSVSGQVITPDSNYNGTLTVPVKVNDGLLDSNSYDLTVTVNAVNDAPQISATTAQTIDEDSSITITTAMLSFADVDSSDDDISLTVMSGDNYTVNGHTVIPDANYHGTLSVAVTLSDGNADSDSANISVTVNSVNDVPSITAGIDQSTSEGQSLNVTLSMLTIEDADHSSNDMTLTVMAGDNYSVSGTTITPAVEFSGLLSVGVKVNDGIDDSNTYTLNVTVSGINDAPVITAAETLTTSEDQALSLSISNLTVTDSDNSLEQLTFMVMAGSNYTVNDTTITPNVDFNGALAVSVKVNDGQLDSNTFAVTVNVLPVNDAPMIIGPTTLAMDEDSSLVLTTAMLQIVDVDTQTNGMGLMISNGENYLVDGTTIIPDAHFNGSLTVVVTVNDGEFNSNAFTLEVMVNAINDAPQITESTAQTIAEDSSLMVDMSMIMVVDIDNSPEQLTLMVSESDNYTVDGMTVMPTADFNGTLLVKLMTNDGSNDSNEHLLNVTVTAVNDNPVAVNDSASVEEDSQSNSINVLSNDSDIDGDTLIIESFTYNGSGTVTIGSGGLIYTPAAKFDGSESVSYTISDGQGGSATATLSITVNNKSSGGGSLPLGLLLMLTFLVLIRRSRV